MLYGPCPTRSGAGRRRDDHLRDADARRRDRRVGICRRRRRCRGCRRRRPRLARPTARVGGAGSLPVAARRTAPAAAPLAAGLGTTTVPGIGVAPGGTVIVPRGVCCPMLGNSGPAGSWRGLPGRRPARRCAISGGGPPSAEGLLRADVDRPQIRFGDLRTAHDVRRQQHDDVGLGDRLVVVREELLAAPAHGSRRESPFSDLSLVLPEQAGQQVRFAVAQAQTRG